MSKSETTLLDDFPAVSYEQWREVVDKDLKGAPFEKKLVNETYEGIKIQPVYTRQDWDAAGNPSGFAGMTPFARGSRLLGNVETGWDVRMEQLDPDLAAANKSLLADLQRGATSLLLRLDANARSGGCPGCEKGKESVGVDGMPLYSTDLLAEALKDVDLAACGISFEAGAAFLPMAAVYLSLLKKQGVDLKAARGAFNADPLAVLARDGELPMSLDVAMKQMADLAGFTSKNLPGMTSVRVGTGPYHHAGATAAQDLAYSMATGVAYLRALTDAGMDVDAAAQQLMFSYSVGCNQFLAIAKLRAARKLWTRVLAACGADTSDGTDNAMFMQVRTSKRVMTQRDPWVNMLRNTVTTFAGAVAGAQVIITEPFDAALGVPDDFSRRIARNTQIILQEESHLSKVVDPAGGSWFLEKLTDDLCEKAWPIFQGIEKQGGMAEALKAGAVHSQIREAFEPRLKNIGRRKDAITGVSEFPNLTEKPVKVKKPDLGAVAKHATDVLHATPASDERKAAIEALGGVSVGTGEATEAATAAAAAGAPIPPMFGKLKGEGDAATCEAIAPYPYARPFEELRDACDAYQAMTGARPKVFMANLGPIAHFTARATYSKNFFEAGGFEVAQDPQGHRGADRDDWEGAAAKAVAACQESGAEIAVLCSSDVIYPAAVPVVAKKLKEAGVKAVILAGAPGENEETYRAGGVDQFIFMKCDVLGILRGLLQDTGVLN